jgi:Zn finger protein HypA/HybF involved in hydrogenase expression
MYVEIKCPNCGFKIGEIKNGALSCKNISVIGMHVICPKCRKPTYKITDLTGGTIVVINSKEVSIEECYLTEEDIQRILKILKGVKL